MKILFFSSDHSEVELVAREFVEAGIPCEIRVRDIPERAQAFDAEPVRTPLAAPGARERVLLIAEGPSWLFRVAPYLIFAATWVAAALVPTFATRGTALFGQQ